MADLDEILSRLEAIERTLNIIERRQYRQPFYELSTGRVMIHTVDTHRLYLDLQDRNMAAAIVEHGYWEGHVRVALRKLLRPGDTFVDVGANIGVHSILGAGLVGPEGRLLCIEAAPATYEILWENIKANGYNLRTNAIHAAATDVDGGMVDFEYVPSIAGMSGMKVPQLRIDRFHLKPEVVQVPSRTIDSLCREHGVIPSVIKIDVEFFEATVLRGSEEIAALPEVAFIVECAGPENSAPYFRERGYLPFKTGAPFDHEDQTIRPVKWADHANWAGGDYVFVRPGSRHAAVLAG